MHGARLKVVIDLAAEVTILDNTGDKPVDCRPTVDGFVARVVEDRDFRRQVNDDLQSRAVHGEGPWKIQDAASVDIQDFL